MAKKKKCPECVEGAPDWLVTFSDMVTLLMCFFVLLLIFMQPKDEVQLMRVLEEVQVALGSSGSPGRVPNNAIPVMSMIPRDDAIALYRTTLRSKQEEETIIKRREPVTSVIQPHIIKNISGNLDFMQNSAELTKEVEDKLVELSRTKLTGRNNIIFIRGHATREEVSAVTNADIRKWELSYLRALAIMNYLKRLGIKEDVMRLEAVADTEDNFTTGGITPRAEILITELLTKDHTRRPVSDTTQDGNGE